MPTNPPEKRSPAPSPVERENLSKTQKSPESSSFTKIPQESQKSTENPSEHPEGVSEDPAPESNSELSKLEEAVLMQQLDRFGQVAESFQNMIGGLAQSIRQISDKLEHLETQIEKIEQSQAAMDEEDDEDAVTKRNNGLEDTKGIKHK